MITKIDVDDIKWHLENNIVNKTNFSEYSLKRLIIDGKQHWIAPDDRFQYRELNDGTLAVRATDVDLLPNFIEIPSSHGDKTVTMIDDGAFIGASFSGAIIPDSISVIGHHAFSNCPYLYIIGRYNNSLDVSKIGEYAFSGCDALGGIILNAGTLEEVGDYAFSSNVFYNFDEDDWDFNVESGAGIDNLVYFFSEEPNYDGKHWHDNDGIPTIWGSECDRNGHDLSYSSTAPTCTEPGWDKRYCHRCGGRNAYYVKPLGHTVRDWAFNEDTKRDHGQCTTCGEYLDREDPFVYEETDDGAMVIGILDDVDISDNVTITSLYRGVPVTTIGNGAFKDCTNFTSVVMPDSIISIGNGAFSHCSSLTSVVIGNGVGTISNMAFYYCTSLKSVVIPESVTTIANWAFQNCSSLTSVTIPDSVASIGFNAFKDCTRLTRIVIPDSVTFIGFSAFYGCSNLVIKVAEGNTHYKVEGGCLIEIESNEITFGNQYSTIPSTASSIGGDAFTGTYAAPIKIPLSIITINSLAFRDCENLVVLVEAPSKPEGWADDWNDGSVTVVWGYVEDTNTYLVTESGEFLTDEQGNLLIL